MPGVATRVTGSLAMAARDVEAAMTEAQVARSQSDYYEALSLVLNAEAELAQAREELERLAGVTERDGRGS